jgi:hypothetical protein
MKSIHEPIPQRLNWYRVRTNIEGKTVRLWVESDSPMNARRGAQSMFPDKLVQVAEVRDLGRYAPFFSISVAAAK